MEYVIAKRNIGSPRVFKTRGRLVEALKRHGAEHVEFRPDGQEVAVRWPEGLCVYSIAQDGTIDEQLAWDMW